MKRWMMSCGVGLALLGGVSIEAGAISLSVDVDPGTAGIQSMRTVMLGDPFSVDVVVSDVVNLNAFEFDLDFLSTILTAIGASSGNFLPNIILPPVVAESDILAPDVNFAEFTIGAFGSSGEGVLASIMFNATALGMSDLTLNEVILSAPFGAPITPVTLENGNIIVDGQQPIPEPGTIVLMATGLGGLLLGRRFMRGNLTVQ